MAIRADLGGRIRRQRARIVAALGLVVALLIATTGTATAWFAAPSGTFQCVVTDSGPVLGLAWSVTSWEPGDLTGENPSIVVEMSRDGGAAETLATGAFTADNGSSFSGVTVVPEGPGTLVLTAYATAPWGDGTIDEGPTSVNLEVPTIASLDDPNCVAQPTPVPTPTEQPTATPEPAPEATPEPTPAETPTPAPQTEGEQVTPEPEPEVEVKAQPPAEQPAEKVLSEELARTGVESYGLALVAVVLLGIGLLTHRSARLATRHDDQA